MYAVQTAAMARSRSYAVLRMATWASAEKVQQPKEAKTSRSRDDRSYHLSPCCPIPEAVTCSTQQHYQGGTVDRLNLFPLSIRGISPQRASLLHYSLLAILPTAK
jgi:hypothetical protein